MEGILHNLSHFFQHFWCCYWPSIKVMIIPGVGIIGSLKLISYKVKGLLRKQTGGIR